MCETSLVICWTMKVLGLISLGLLIYCLITAAIILTRVRVISKQIQWMLDAKNAVSGLMRLFGKFKR